LAAVAALDVELRLVLPGGVLLTLNARPTLPLQPALGLVKVKPPEISPPDKVWLPVSVISVMHGSRLPVKLLMTKLDMGKTAQLSQVLVAQ